MKNTISRKNIKKRVSNRSPENLMNNELRGPLLGPKIDENHAPEALEIAKSIEKTLFWRDPFFVPFLDREKTRFWSQKWSKS